MRGIEPENYQSWSRRVQGDSKSLLIKYCLLSSPISGHLELYKSQSLLLFPAGGQLAVCAGPKTEMSPDPNKQTATVNTSFTGTESEV